MTERYRGASFRPNRQRSERIDAHHHFWRYSAAEFDWIDEPMASLRRDFLPETLAPELEAAGMDGVISVQARQSLEETQWLLKLAETTPWIRGVVGWAPLASAGFRSSLEELREFPLLRGLRHVLQGEPDDYMLRADFNEGLAALSGTGLVYDVLIFARQLPAALELVDRHPNQVFVLDHIAKPRIADSVVEPWAVQLRELAKRDHVFCKLSGMVTEANWTAWTIDDLRPYLDVVLEAFGPQRLMAGSDWPVCTVATSYGDWFTTLREMLLALTTAEQDRIFGGTAMEVYRLEETQPAAKVSAGSTASEMRRA